MVLHVGGVLETEAVLQHQAVAAEVRLSLATRPAGRLRSLSKCEPLTLKAARILHGKGYGILMQVIHQELKGMREIRSFHPEKVELGGVGVTIVNLR